MAKHWIADLEDPRTTLLVSVVVLAVGWLAVASWLSRGALEAVWAVVWIVVSVGQLIWALIRYFTWRRRRPTFGG